MFTPNARIRVYVCREATSMQKSFAGLQGMVRCILEHDPLSGHLFCFFNRRCNYVKALWWDVSGFCIWAKKLSRGTFAVPSAAEITLSELQRVLDGIDFKVVRQRRRFFYFPEANCEK